MAERVKGVRDFAGKEAVLRQDMSQRIRDAYKCFGFEPVETPSFEYLSLFTNKSGPGIEEQLYSFSDKKGEKLALRPEHTISKLRVISGNKSFTKPIKTYSIGNVWRYEDPRKARWREFIQADIDVFGSSNLRYDAEVIACIDFAIKKLGLSNYMIRLSNRKVLQAILEELEVGPIESIQVLREIDKKDKVGIDGVLKKVTELIGSNKAQKVKLYLEGKLEPKGDGIAEIEKVTGYLKEYGIKNVFFDRSLVRGQDYYDGTIFEFEYGEGQYSKVVFASGGRYDKLSKKFDSDLPIVGGSIGFDVVMEIAMASATEDFSEDYCVLNVDSIEKAIEIAGKLRKKGLVTDILLDNVSLSKGLEYCNAKKIRYAVIIGKKDLEKDEVTIRDLKDKKDKKIKESEI